MTAVEERGSAAVRTPGAPDVSGTLDLAGRFERPPMTRYQRTIFLIIATAWLFDSIDLAALTFVPAPVSDGFSLSTAQAGLLASASIAGLWSALYAGTPEVSG